MAKGNRSNSTAVAIKVPADDAPIDDIPRARTTGQAATFAGYQLRAISEDGANFDLEDIASLYDAKGKNGRKLLSASARESLKQSIRRANSLKRSLNKLSTEECFVRALQIALTGKAPVNHEQLVFDHRADLFEETEFGNSLAYRLDKQWKTIVTCSGLPIEAKPYIELAIGYYLWTSSSADLIYPVTYRKLQQLSLWADKVRDGVRELIDAPDTFEALQMGAAKDVPFSEDQREKLRNGYPIIHGLLVTIANSLQSSVERMTYDTKSEHGLRKHGDLEALVGRLTMIVEAMTPLRLTMSNKGNRNARAFIMCVCKIADESRKQLTDYTIKEAIDAVRCARTFGPRPIWKF